MNRFERLLIPIVLVVMAGAFLLESAGPSSVRTIALTIGLLLVLAIVVGMIHRVRRKGRAEPPAPDQTSNGRDEPPAA